MSYNIDDDTEAHIQQGEALNTFWALLQVLSMQHSFDNTVVW